MQSFQLALGFMSPLRRRVCLAVFCVVAVGASACSGDSSDDSAAETTAPPPTTETTLPPPSDTPKEGPVTIANQVDFNFRPVTGTFEVTEGADILGCSSGSFADAGTPTDGIQRVYTCDSGPNDGSFTASFNFLAEELTVSDSGTWSISEGSDDFVGLQGGGDWSIVYATDDSDIGVGEWTGDISYTS